MGTRSSTGARISIGDSKGNGGQLSDFESVIRGLQVVEI